MKAVSPHTITKVFKRNKNLVWRMKHVTVVKLVSEKTWIIERLSIIHGEKQSIDAHRTGKKTCAGCFTREFF